MLIGKAGADILNGGEGNDVLRGWRGPDTLNGDGGNDYLYGGRGQDILNGGDGDDVLYGRQHADVLNGGAGDDELRGNRGPDTLDGGPGTDVLNGGQGNDACSTGENYTNCEDVTDQPVTVTVHRPQAGEEALGSVNMLVEVAGLESGQLVYSIGGSELLRRSVNSGVHTLDLRSQADGPLTIDVSLVDSTGTVVAVTAVQVTNRIVTQQTGAAALEAYGSAFEAGTISASQFLRIAVPAAAAATERPDLPEADGEENETTALVLAAALEAWDEATPEARAEILLMNHIQIVPDPGPAGLIASAVAGCPDRVRVTWGLGQIFESSFCVFDVKADELANALGFANSSKFTDIRYYVDPDYVTGFGGKFDANAYSAPGFPVGLDLPTELVEGAKLIWESERVHENRGFQLPKAHRVDGIPLSVFVVDNSQRAYSSPFEVTSKPPDIPNFPSASFLFDEDLGHPIRLSGPKGDLRTTIVHELFHTFEWDTINWAADVLVGPNPPGGQLENVRGETVALYESAATWGTHEVYEELGRTTRYGTGAAVNHWLATPQNAFLFSPDRVRKAIEAPGISYSYWPSMLWLDEHVRSSGSHPTNESPGGTLQSVITSYAGSPIGGSPQGKINDEIAASALAGSGPSPAGKAWPRMWTALYLLQSADAVQTANPELFAAADTPDFRWLYFWDSTQIANLRGSVAMANSTATEEDFFGTERPGRYTSAAPVHLSPAVSTRTVTNIGVAKGGAAFFDVRTSFTDSAVIQIEIDVSSDPEDWEASVMQFDGKHPNLCLDEVTGNPAVQISENNGASNTITLSVAVDTTCKNFTVALVNVDVRASSTQTNPGTATSPTITFSVTETASILTDSVLPDGAAGQPYSPFALLASAPALWSIVGGELPVGLTLTPAGTLSGLPRSGGAHTFSARATFAGLPPVDKEFSVSVVGPWLVTTSLADGQVSDSYSQSLVADVHYPEFGQNHPGRPAISGFELGVGSLPDGLTLNTSSGLISGIPTADGAHDFTVLVHDTAGNTGSKGYSLTIGTPSRAHLHFQAVTTPDPVVPGQAATGVITVTNTGGDTATGRTLRFRLPDGFSSISAPGCGLVAGQTTVFDCPLADIDPGDVIDFNVSFTVPAGFGPTARVFRFGDLKPVFADTGYIIAYLNQGQSYSHQIVATDPDGDDADLVFSIIAGSLPPGFDMDSSGLITGVMQVDEQNYVWNFTVQVADATGAVETAELRLWINQTL